MFHNNMKSVGFAESDFDDADSIIVRFTCPNCGGHRLDIESADVLGCQEVHGIDSNHNLVCKRPEFFMDESHFYCQCPDCGYEPNVDLDGSDPEQNLVAWMNAQHNHGSKDDENNT
jgi:predicted RNA-binding Zn-ribbon protein involved in translation (DUF1610 family)